MVVTRSHASKYNIKLNNEIDNLYVFRFIYILFCLSLPFILYSIIVNYNIFDNYFTENKYNKQNEYNFILLENNLPEKTFEYLSTSLYDKLPAKSYEKNYNYFDKIFNQFLYKFITEDRYNYYLNFFN